MIGQFVTSLAGHDKGVIYIILKEDEEYVYLVDGKYKTLESPKKKNKKHIQRINQFINKEDNHTINNEKIKFSIKNFSKEI